MNWINILGVKSLNTKILATLSMIPVLTLLLTPLPAFSQGNDSQVMLADYQYNQ
jgi:hypothetical protein